MTAAAKAYVLTQLMAKLKIDPKNFSMLVENSTILNSINSTISSLSSDLDIEKLDDTFTEDTLNSLEENIETCIEEDTTVDNIQSFTVNSTDIENYFDRIVSYLNSIIEEKAVTVITTKGKYDCSITRTAITDGIDITINCPTFDITATTPPVFSTENTFAATVEDATDNSLIGTPVVVTTSYYGGYVAQFLNGTYKNYRVNADGEGETFTWNWENGQTTYTYDSVNKELIVDNGEQTFNVNYSVDPVTGEISGTDTTNTIKVSVYPILKDNNGNVLTFYKVTSVSDGTTLSQNIEILLKQ